MLPWNKTQTNGRYINLVVYIKQIEDFMQVTKYKWEWITRGRSVAAVCIHRKETTVLVRPTEEMGTTAMDF
jgi:hypothetical protein